MALSFSGGHTPGQAAAFRKQRSADSAKVGRQLLAEDLRRLRAELAAAQAHKRETVKGARATCKACKHEHIARLRAELTTKLELLRREYDALRKHARASCDRQLADIRAREATAVEKAKAARVAEAQYQKSLAKIGRAHTKQISGAQRAHERRSESDDAVESSLTDARHLALWRKVKRSIKGSGRMTRLEAFEHYVHENPDEVYQSLDEVGHARARKLQREHDAAERKLARANAPARKRRAAGAAAVDLSDVPF